MLFVVLVLIFSLEVNTILDSFMIAKLCVLFICGAPTLTPEAIKDHHSISLIMLINTGHSR